MATIQNALARYGQPAGHYPSETASPASSARAAGQPAQAEMTPFCGMHLLKIANYCFAGLISQPILQASFME